MFNRLLELGKIGYKEGKGINCIAFSKEEQEAMELIKVYMEEAGLQVRVDYAGNLIGRKEGIDPSAPVVMTGSHIDTVYNGGIFDGRLGIIGGIEVLQTMNENGILTKHPLEVCVYRDEEGVRFSGVFSGSTRMTKDTRPLRLDVEDRDGITLKEALEGCGIDSGNIENARLPEGYAKAHIELHIEQGGVLENKNLSVGVVTGISCQVRGEIILKGKASHAGTTPMSLRRDSLMAAAEILIEIEKEANATDSGVATVGKIQVLPGGVNIVPGMVKFSVDIRDQYFEVREELLNKILLKVEEICVKRKIDFEFDIPSERSKPKLCSSKIQSEIENVCKILDIPTIRMLSGAGHDSSNFADFCDMGMIFVRSQNAISHNPDEWSTKEDCVDGVNVLYHTLLRLAE